MSAERARVSRSWVVKWRGLDPAFDAAVRGAVEAAKARLKAEARDGTVPPRGWGHLDGVELAVRGTNGRRVQIARARLGDWSPAVERRFLDALGATCNVKAALAEVGRSKGSAYTHRKRWPAFAKNWDQVLEEAYAALEVALFQNAENLFSTPDYVPETVIRDMKVDDAIHLLHMQKGKVLGIGGRPGARWRRPPTLEEVKPASSGRSKRSSTRGSSIRKRRRRGRGSGRFRAGSGERSRRCARVLVTPA